MSSQLNMGSKIYGRTSRGKHARGPTTRPGIVGAALLRLHDPAGGVGFRRLFWLRSDAESVRREQGRSAGGGDWGCGWGGGVVFAPLAGKATAPVAAGYFGGT